MMNLQSWFCSLGSGGQQRLAVIQELGQRLWGQIVNKGVVGTLLSYDSCMRRPLYCWPYRVPAWLNMSYP